MHLGNPQFNEEFFNYWETKFKQAPHNKIIYIMGNLIEFASLRVDPWGQVSSADRQINSLIDLLEPYKKYIRMSTQGNHAGRPRKEYNLDIGTIVSEALDIPYHRSQFWDTLYMNDREITVFGKHGRNSSKYTHTAMGAAQRDTNQIQADIFLEGHNHRTRGWSEPLMTKDGLTRKYYAFTGSFLGYHGSYAEDRNMIIRPEGFIRLTVNKDVSVDFKEYHIDKCLPSAII